MRFIIGFSLFISLLWVKATFFKTEEPKPSIKIVSEMDAQPCGHPLTHRCEEFSNTIVG